MPIAWRRIVLPGTIHTEPHGSPDANDSKLVSSDYAAIIFSARRRNRSANTCTWKHWNARPISRDYVLPNSIFRNVCPNQSTHTNKWNICPYINHFSSAFAFTYSVAETHRQLPTIPTTNDLIYAIRCTVRATILTSNRFTHAISSSVRASFHGDRVTVCCSLILSNT
jgi:hypothetical protein